MCHAGIKSQDWWDSEIMPYKNKEDYRELDKKRQRKKSLIAKYNIDGKFDVRAFLEDNLPLIAEDLITSGKSIPSRKTEMILKILDIYKDKQEVTQKVEFTVADRQQEYRNFLEWGRGEAEATGVCPMCLQRKTLRSESCLDTRPEQPEDNSVEALDIPF